MSPNAGGGRDLRGFSRFDSIFNLWVAGLWRDSSIDHGLQGVFIPPQQIHSHPKTHPIASSACRQLITHSAILIILVTC